MVEKTKKILMIIGFIFIVIVLAFFIWFMFFKSNSVSNVDLGGNTTNNNDNNGKLPSSGGSTNTGKDIIIDDEILNNPNLTPEQIKDIINQNNGQDLENINNNTNNNTGEKITDMPENSSDIANGGSTISKNVIKYPTLNSIISGNNLITFNKEDGGFYKLDSITGVSQLMTENKFKGAQNIIWSPTSDKTIIEFPDGSNIMYDFNKNKQYTLPKDWYNFSFQKDGEKIAFLIDSNMYKGRWLSIADPDGSKLSAIEPLGNNADRVIVDYSPNEQMIAMSRTGEAIGGLNQQILLIGLNNENFKALDVYGRGFHPIWTPAGDKVVYDAYNSETSYNPNLWVVNAGPGNIGTSHKNLGITTWVSKCGFDSTGKFLYCGVPKDTLPPGTGIFPETLDDGEFYDNIYKINIYTGYSQLIAKPIPNISVESLYVSDDDSILYYKDKKTGYIYNMRLK